MKENITFTLIGLFMLIGLSVVAIKDKEHKEHKVIVETNQYFTIYEDTVRCTLDTLVHDMYVPVLRPAIGLDGGVYLIFD